jgi:catechol 2,3-dioxygenase-like lactoylglutathione lyase family enzyme
VPDINGIAHIQLTVGDVQKSIPFYRDLLLGLGLTLVNDTERSIYGVGGRTGISISAADPEFQGERFKQRHPGLHHFCFRCRSREDVDEVHELRKRLTFPWGRIAGLQ